MRIRLEIYTDTIRQLGDVDLSEFTNTVTLCDFPVPGPVQSIYYITGDNYA